MSRTISDRVKSQRYLLHFDVVVSQNLLSTEHFSPVRKKKTLSDFTIRSSLSALSASHSVVLCFPLVDTAPLWKLPARKWTPLVCAVAKLNRVRAAHRRPCAKCTLDW